MKKLLTGLFTLAATASLAACSGQANAGEGMEKLVVGASSTPHAEILEFAKPILAEKGIDLEIKVFQDYVLPNMALEDGEIDANYFQHVPYLEQFNADNGTDLVSAGGVHVEPIGIYSQKISSLDELKDGARLIMSNSISDQGRILALLQSVGLIKLDPNVDPAAARISDIVENPKNLVIEADIDPGLLVQAYKNGEGDAVLINTNFALDGGLNPLEDAIALENSDSPYVNIVAVKAGNENDEKIKTLMEVLQSDEVANFITEQFQGAVVPAATK